MATSSMTSHAWMMSDRVGESVVVTFVWSALKVAGTDMRCKYLRGVNTVTIGKEMAK